MGNFHDEKVYHLTPNSIDYRGDKLTNFLYPKDMPHYPTLSIPGQFYVVLTKPALWAGMPYPTDQTPWQEFYDSGFRRVVCLADAYPDYDPDPLTVLYSEDLEDLFHGGSPRDPEQETRFIRDATRLVFESISRGEGTIIHCLGGTGRTGTVMGCVLKALQFSANDIIDYLDRVNIARGRRGWPESAWQSDFVASFVYDSAKDKPNS